MSGPVLILGAGMGGLTAALRLARQGIAVQVLEARGEAGGLAMGTEIEGFPFDAGPYILLDRPGLEAAFRAVGLTLSDRIELRPILFPYQVTSEGAVCRFYAEETETAAGFDHDWPGSGAQYRRFIAETRRTFERLSPLLKMSHPTPVDLFRVGAWRETPFLLRSLGAILERTGLPAPLRDAIAIWTHIAGESVDRAPSPLAFVPALIHTVGAYYPVGGIAAIPRTLIQAAVQAGVVFRYKTSVRAIRTKAGRVCSIETESGEEIRATSLISNISGIGTYCELVEATPEPVRAQLERLPLQSPGVCAYLAVRGTPTPPYLRFRLPGKDELCRLFIQPGVMDASLSQEGWWPARLMSPMRYADATRLGEAGQRAYLEKILSEAWWREGVTEFRVLTIHTPTTWGAQFHLYRDSMNPVMTARFMRQGRLAHRSPYVRGLYLAGSATHPGQWVSFCALSGVLAADCLIEDRD